MQRISDELERRDNGEWWRYPKSGDGEYRLDDVSAELCETIYAADRRELEKVVRIVKLLHDELDKINGEIGSRDRFCLFCKSTKYDASGIVHYVWCPIFKARKVLAKYLKEEQ